MSERPIIIATRGSALALAQSNMILAQCRAAFPHLAFGLEIIKTTGDKLQKGPLADQVGGLPKGLFTKELEVALLNRSADLAVHSLKDLPTELPVGLKLGAVSRRADVRDVLIYRAADPDLRKTFEMLGVTAGEQGRLTGAKPRGFTSGSGIVDLPAGAVVATSSTRRKAQLLAHNPQLKVVEIRGNVATRLEKLAEQPELDAIILAAAGLERLNFAIAAGGELAGAGVPDGLLAMILKPEVMLPCVGQGALGIEVRENDDHLAEICARLDDPESNACATAERAFLAAMGGGCQSPVGAYAEVSGDQVRMRVVSFQNDSVGFAEATGPIGKPIDLGRTLAARLRQ